VSRAHITIDREIGRIGDGPLAISVRGVTIRKRGETFNARCYFREVNGNAVYSVGECPDATFEAVCDAFENQGSRRLAKKLQEAQ